MLPIGIALGNTVVVIETPEEPTISSIPQHIIEITKTVIDDRLKLSFQVWTPLHVYKNGQDDGFRSSSVTFSKSNEGRELLANSVSA